MEWEIPELQDLNEMLRQDDEEGVYYTGYGAACTLGSVAGGSCIAGMAVDATAE